MENGKLTRSDINKIAWDNGIDIYEDGTFAANTGNWMDRWFTDDSSDRELFAKGKKDGAYTLCNRFRNLI